MEAVRYDKHKGNGTLFWWPQKYSPPSAFIIGVERLRSKTVFKMAEDVGGEIVAVAREHLNKVKQALSSRSNMDKSLNEEAVHAVSEMHAGKSTHYSREGQGTQI
jgi:hypothetical protein